MPAVKFTDTFVKNAKNDTDKVIDYLATNQKGLHLRVSPQGTKTFILNYRSKLTGKPVNETMGRYPEIDYATAIDWAQKGLKQNALGQPVVFSLTKKNGGATVAEMLTVYNTTKLTQKRSGRQIFTALTSFTTNNKWSDLPFTSLNKKQIMAALNDMDGRRYATSVQQMMSTWLKWGVIHDHLPANPIAGMPPVGGEQKPREHTLSLTEISKLWVACRNPRAHGLRTVYADTLLLILTTGCRPGMACGMVEDELFGIEGRPAAWRAGAGAVWDVPAERMKMALPFTLSLNPLALEIIERRRALTTNGVLFPTPSKEFKDKGKAVRVRRLSAITMELSKRLGFKKPFTPHDLRRTASDLLCREFDVMTEVNAFLAHETVRGVMKHYNPQNRWNGIERKRVLSERLATMLQEIVSKPTSGGPVVEIRRAA